MFGVSLENNCNPLQLYILSTDFKSSCSPWGLLPADSEVILAESVGTELSLSSSVKQYLSDQLLKETRKTTVPDKDVVLNKNVLNQNKWFDQWNKPYDYEWLVFMLLYIMKLSSEYIFKQVY